MRSGGVSGHGAHVLLAAGALALAAAAAGAGGSGAARYRAQADAICARDRQQLSALPPGLRLAAYLVDALKVTRTAYGALERLSPPASLAQLHAAVVANIAAGFPIVERLLARAQAGRLTVAQFQHDAALRKNAAAENGLWKRLGATRCLA